MIFVTVGTHEQPFNRLIEAVDSLKRDGIIRESVCIQIGYSTYEPKYCEWHRLLPSREMDNMVRHARIVITHGGPSSFIMPLRLGKVPIVVPRQFRFGEHVNDHQLTFAKEVQKRKKNIIVVSNIQSLSETIRNYDVISAGMKSEIMSNNKRFNENLEIIAQELIKPKKRIFFNLLKRR